MRALFAALCLASPAFGQDQAFWDGTGCAIQAVTGQAHVAEVTCHNRLTGGVNHNEGLIVAGIEVVVIIDHMPGDEPDTFTIIPPDGFAAVPQSVTLPEHEGAVILIFPFIGS